MGKSPSPGYRRQKRRLRADLAFVELTGVRHYVGAYGSEESRSEYHRIVAEWEANGRQPPVERDELDVEELTARYLQFATAYYRDADGNETSEPRNFRTVIRYLNELYADLPAATFGPRALSARRRGRRRRTKSDRRRVRSHTSFRRRSRASLRKEC